MFVFGCVLTLGAAFKSANLWRRSANALRLRARDLPQAPAAHFLASGAGNTRVQRDYIRGAHYNAHPVAKYK